MILALLLLQLAPTLCDAGITTANAVTCSQEPITISGDVFTNPDPGYSTDPGWSHAIDVSAEQSIENNVDTIGALGSKDPCQYQGRYDPRTKACVLVIRFAKMDHLVCSAVEPAQKQDDDDIVPKGVTQQITCMYDPKE